MNIQKKKYFTHLFLIVYILSILSINNLHAQSDFYPDFDCNRNVKTADWKESIQIIEPACWVLCRKTL